MLNLCSIIISCCKCSTLHSMLHSNLHSVLLSILHSNLHSNLLFIHTCFFYVADEYKSCPRCKTMINKMDDGSCNHMTCSICGAQFCWLCLKEASDLHYLRWVRFGITPSPPVSVTPLYNLMLLMHSCWYQLQKKYKYLYAASKFDKNARNSRKMYHTCIIIV